MPDYTQIPDDQLTPAEYAIKTQQIAELDEPLEVRRVSQDCGLRRCFDRGLEPHLGHLPLGTSQPAPMAGPPRSEVASGDRRVDGADEAASAPWTAIACDWGSRPSGTRLPRKLKQNRGFRR